MNVYGVIMAGGGGTRFWPLSRREKPKQLLNLSGNGAMINETADRLFSVVERENTFLVTNELQTAGTLETLEGRIPEKNVFSEPASRNTAACIGFAAVKILKERGDGIMIVTPSDAYIRDREAFIKTLKIAVSAAEKEDKLITIGIKPTFPATGYGYIRHEKGGGAVKKVLRFVEKPDLARAKRYFAQGDYVWNSGMFLWKVSAILEKIRTLLPALYEGLMKIYEAAGTEKEKETVSKVYPGLLSVSIDYGIMEKSKDILVVPGEFGWSDVGSWDMLGAIHAADGDGNIIVGDAFAYESEDNVIYAPKKLVAAAGVKDLVIVDTPDAILVCKKDRVQEVKNVVEALKKRGREDLL